MFLSKRVVIICSFFLSFGPSAWSQFLPTPPTVYVSGGSSIYSVTVVNDTAVVTQLVNSTGSNFESLAIGPDNADLTTASGGIAAGNALHPVLLYACDTAGKTVIRFVPGNPAVIQTVYSGGVGGITPLCGRSTSTGDFYVTDKAAGGVYLLSAGGPVANFPFTGTVGATATPVSGTTPAAPRAITQKYVGDP